MACFNFHRLVKLQRIMLFGRLLRSVHTLQPLVPLPPLAILHMVSFFPVRVTFLGCIPRNLVLSSSTSDDWPNTQENGKARFQRRAELSR